MADTDRELLELAAKAAGHTLVWGEKYAIGGDTVDCSDIPYIKSIHPDELDAYWNPLTDDGDALRLAVKLKLWADFFDDAICVGCVPNDNEATQLMEPVGTDPYAATRRVIVRAAAAIGGGK